MNFENNIKEIQQILTKLEDNSVSFDESLNLFEIGIKLTKECQDYLNDCKNKLQIIKEEMEK